MDSSRTRRLVELAVIFAAFFICTPAFAQTGGLTGKCIGQDGKPLVGYTIKIENVEVKWNGKVKTDKKGAYVYIGLSPGNYKATLLGPDGNVIQSDQKHVSFGDPTELNFDVKAAVQEAQKELATNPEYQKQVQAQVAAQKESANLKQVFDEGRDLANQKQYVQAAADFEKALPLAKDRNIPIVLSQLAIVWYQAAGAETNPDQRKEYQAKSLDYFNKCLAISPSDPGLHSSLGKLYIEMGRTDDAVAELQKAAQLDPTHATGYYLDLGAIMYNKGKMDEAAAALKQATAADPANAKAWFRYGMALMGKANYKADGTILPAPGTVEAFQTYLKLAPTGPNAPEAKASIDALTGKTNLEYKSTKKTH